MKLKAEGSRSEMVTEGNGGNEAPRLAAPRTFVPLCEKLDAVRFTVHP